MKNAFVAQLVEHLFCKEDVGSSPIVGSNRIKKSKIKIMKMKFKYKRKKI